jgi:S-formylglutathione hydrolase
VENTPLQIQNPKSKIQNPKSKMNLETLTQTQCFGGPIGTYQHPSTTCNGPMKFAVYQPPQAATEPVPVLYFLSGLTCTEENFIQKAGAQRFAATHGLMLVAPDTSPRGANVPGEADSWDLGTGAGFYVDATQAPWRAHYQMYSYITQELPAVIAANFPVKAGAEGICGHSMGGHGALVCGLRNGEKYRSVSAFAPIVAPSQCAWGQKALGAYLGEDASAWSNYDATELVQRHQHPQTLLIDQGLDDPFLENQLMPQLFEQACQQSGQLLNLRRHPGYDHSYYFISTFMEDHIRHHAAILWG